jgi:anti-sigma factor RsiW
MRRSQERVNAETKRLLCYLDGEMSRDEAEDFRARLADSPALTKQLQEMQRVGGLVRGWAAVAEVRGAELLEPTLARVQKAERRRQRQTTVGYAIATALLLVLPWSRQPPELVAKAAQARSKMPSAAAIERIEAGDKQAHVFVLRGSTTPVVWLADDAPDDAPYLQDPG